MRWIIYKIKTNYFNNNTYHGKIHFKKCKKTI